MARKGLLALAGALVVAALAGTPFAFGHSDYESSVPASGATLTTAPTRVDVYFTEDLFAGPGANHLSVRGPTGNSVGNNDTTLDPADHQHLYITLQSGLTSGQYTVDWQNRSAEDGDDQDGSFTFTLSLVEPTAPPAAGPTPGGGGTAATAAPVSGAPAVGSGPGEGGFHSAILVALATAGLVTLGVGAALRVRSRRA